MTNIKRLFFILPLFFISAAQAAEILTLDMAIDKAVLNNPSLASAQKTLEASGSRVWQSAAVFFPTISASGSISRSREEDTRPSNDYEYSDSMRAGLSADMPLLTFGRNYFALSAQKANYKSSEFDFANTLNQTVFNVKKAYFNLVLAQKTKTVLKDTVKLYEEHLKQAQAFFNVGIRPKIDVTNAEVNLNSNKITLFRAENAVTTAFATLNNLMGIKDSGLEYQVDENIDFVPYQMSLEDAIETALLNRPDFLSAQFRAEASQKTLNAAKAEHFPTISANASYGFRGDKSLEYDNGSVGISASLPLFNGFKTTSRINELSATREARLYDQEASRQNVIMDVTQAVSNLEDAQNRVPVARQSVEVAKENFDLARGRYKVGIGSNIELVDAENSYRNAELQYATALTDYRIAIADALRAVGTK